MVSGNFHFLLLSKVMTILVKRMRDYQLSKFNCMSKTNQISIQNFPTPLFGESCQEHISTTYPPAQIQPETNLISELLYFGKLGALFGKPSFYFNEYTFVILCIPLWLFLLPPKT